MYNKLKSVDEIINVYKGYKPLKTKINQGYGKAVVIVYDKERIENIPFEKYTSLGTVSKKELYNGQVLILNNKSIKSGDYIILDNNKVKVNAILSMLPFFL